MKQKQKEKEGKKFPKVETEIIPSSSISTFLPSTNSSNSFSLLSSSFSSLSVSSSSLKGIGSTTQSKSQTQIQKGKETTKNNGFLWSELESGKLLVDFFQPKSFSDIVGNVEPLRILRNSLMTNWQENFLLSGPSGVGKTSALEVLAKELFPDPKNYQDFVLKINASDQRGKSLFQETIRLFLKKKSKSVFQGHETYKLVILDEVDGLLNKSFLRLNKMLTECKETNKYSPARFFLACNNVGCIPQFIFKQVNTLYFEPLSPTDIRKRLFSIFSTLDLQQELGGIDAIVSRSEGDLRSALNILHKVLESTKEGKKITPLVVAQACDQPVMPLLQDILRNCVTNSLQQAISAATVLLEDGYSTSDFLDYCIQICRQQKPTCEEEKTIVPLLAKPFFLKQLLECKSRISEGVDTPLQLTSLLARLCRWKGELSYFYQR